jgi:hypothetical protein
VFHLAQNRYVAFWLVAPCKLICGTNVSKEYAVSIWLTKKKSQLSLENKITIYKAITKPVWTYGIELWGCSKPSNTKILQTFQSKTLRKLANPPWYISNATLHNDLRIPYVTEVIRTYAKNHKNRTAQNNNQLIKDMFNQPEIGRRLNRMWPEDLTR